MQGDGTGGGGDGDGGGGDGDGGGGDGEGGGGTGGGGDGSGGTGGALGGGGTTTSRTCAWYAKSDATALAPPPPNGASAKHSGYSPTAASTATDRLSPTVPPTPCAKACEHPPSACGTKRASSALPSAWLPVNDTTYSTPASSVTACAGSGVPSSTASSI